MPEISLISALLVGLLGGTHCVGMCGGIVGAISLQMPGNVPQWRIHLAYNLGRIASYGAAGVLAGAAGAGSLLLSDMLPVKVILYLIANLLLVFLGLYLAGLSHAVVQIELRGDRQTLVRGSVDPDGAPGHHYDALKRSMACEIIRVVERLFVGTTSAHDRDGAMEIRQLAHDAKQARGIGKITKLRWVVGAQSAHQLSARR